MESALGRLHATRILSALDYWHYRLDHKYVNLDQEIIDYLFPAFQIRR
ncbi:MAG: hypothetical protein ACOYON_06995 [Fimbriimonas sp.]